MCCQGEGLAQPRSALTGTLVCLACSHRARVAVGGKLQKFGAPTQQALERALPGQLDTCLNTLRMIDALNALLQQRLVETTTDAMSRTAHRPPAGSSSQGSARSVERGPSFGLFDRFDEGVPFRALLEWNDGILVRRFAGLAQYLRSGKRFGLIHFDGEYPHGEVVVHSSSVGHGRPQLLRTAMRQPQLLVPAWTKPEALEAEVLCRTGVAAKLAGKTLDGNAATGWPTRVCSASSAAEASWRSASGKSGGGNG